MYLLVYLAVYPQLNYGANMAYYRATMGTNAGRGNYYAYCTVPVELREVLGKRKIRKTLGTSDRRIASQKLRDEGLRSNTITSWKNHAPVDALRLNGLFDAEERWDWYDEIRDQAGFVMSYEALAGDYEEELSVAKAQSAIEPLLFAFSEEFRKVSSEDYAPKKRTILFKDVAAKYFADYEFTNGLEREKTQDDYRASINKFMRWAGDIDLSMFAGQEGRKFMVAYADEMVDNREIIPIFRGDRPSSATLTRHFAAVKNVLNYAKSEGLVADSLWDDYKGVTKRKAEKELKPIAFTEPQVLQVLAMKKKPREQLLFQLAIGTGCRLDEIALLTWDQIGSEMVDGVEVPYLDFTPLSTKVKRETSHRRVPLVPDVFACLPPRNKSPFGCAKEPNRLFDYPKKKDGKTDAASKAGMRQIRKLFPDPRLVNHSFRHYFVNKTREAELWLPITAVNYVTGHKMGAGERDNYGDGYGLKQVYTGLCKLDFSFLNPKFSSTG